ncbi:hypothetical protein PPACK8108_LOCUS13497 [Phakopsora pachyrhizi]|uniref:Uncharacterized protein n=1 Tax=Phakopsora pachyrhizi TaxID=170000 RepID=A0AAV0B773_PHAPC|nr:hypothetical protein PPACK8108_LOCUS13497 [Phakopsora pachyrhizi]
MRSREDEITNVILESSSALLRILRSRPQRPGSGGVRVVLQCMVLQMSRMPLKRRRRSLNASLESCRCQAKYIKLEKLFANAAFLTEAVFESGFLESGETQSEVNTCLSPQSHIPNQRFSSPLSSIKLLTRIESGSIKNDIDRHQQEQNEREDMEQKESQLCDSDYLVMMDGWSGVVDIVKSVCGGDYNEDDLDFELDEKEDSVCGVQRAADHVSSYSNRRISLSLLEI